MKKLKANWIKKTPLNRLYHIPVPIIGLTGGIATGKSTLANFFRKNDIPVIDADRLVKNIYQLPETKAFIKDNFPTTIIDDEIIFKKLREIAFQDETAKKLLEDFIYAHLPNEFKKAFVSFDDPKFVVYDVPLLFEKKLNEFIDFSICVYAPKNIQIERLIARDHSTIDLAEKIINQQMDIEVKKNLCDFVINNIGSPEELDSAIEKFIKDITI